MLVKWVWRFGRENSSLWKRVVCAKYGIDETRLKWNWQSSGVASPFIKVVARLYRVGSDFAWILEENLKENRNHIVFKGGDVSSIQVIDSNKFRVGWWFKHLGKGSKDPITTILCNIKDICTESSPAKKVTVEDWIPLARGCLKFIVDGSARGKPGPAGIGGVLCNSDGRILCMFSQFVGSLDSNTAEILAIRQVVQLCASKPFLVGSDITIITDSKVAVSWIHDDDFGSLTHISAVYDIRTLLADLGGISVVYNSRVTNAFGII
ncbi:hypothetical protein Ddye_027693 [Dipteronia dyeriana]|uniref:RNase H type-1 domain-containing protein n=1 Tax=Dipteronia dyeriana TaxID=168575 RepID=A0AAD9TQ18_9ROSI|nr:hypothetical protein Ddye_027693 [Dipteronia dyeriana]